MGKKWRAFEELPWSETVEKGKKPIHLNYFNCFVFAVATFFQNS